MQIKLSKGYEATIDFSDWWIVQGYAWFALEAGPGLVYACATAKTRDKVLMHRLILQVRVEEDVDHINGNGLYNRRENLRAATRSQNMMAANYAPGISGYRGVTPNGPGWEARVQAAGIVHLLGTYATQEEAARVRDEAAIRLHGKFARLNFPLTKYEG